MRNLLFLILFIALSVSCENQSSKDDNTSSESPVKKESPKSFTKDDDRVSGLFEVRLDGQSYKSTQLEDNYCDMNFSYNGDKSMLSIRFQDVFTHDILLINIKGSEEMIKNPTGTIENMGMTGTPSAMISFYPADGINKMQPLVLAEGSLEITKFDEGKIVANFSGMGGTMINSVKKENLFPYEGKVNMETKNIKIIGGEE